MGAPVKSDSHFVPCRAAYLKPPHIGQIGPAFPLLLKLDDLVTAAEGADGIVLGGRPVTDEFIGKQLEIHPKTIQHWRKTYLERHGYTESKRVQHGLIIRVKNSLKMELKAGKSPRAAQQTADPKDRPNESTPNLIWATIGADGPLGTPKFQRVLEFYFTCRNGKPTSEVLEQVIQRCQNQKISIPRPLYELKRKVELAEKASVVLPLETVSVGASRVPTVRDIRPRER